jgi:hypothetical protein
MADSLVSADSALLVASDTIPGTGPDYNAIYIDLLLFTEDPGIQYLTDNTREDRRMLQMIFARPLTDTFSYRVLNEEVEFLEHFSTRRDTLSLWIRDSTDYLKDTLILEARYTVLDTIPGYLTQVDTLRFVYRDKSAGKKKGNAKSGDTGEEQKLILSSIRANGEQHLHRDLKVDLNVPLLSINDSLVGFYHKPDTVELPVDYSFYRDSILPTRGWFHTRWESASRYRLYLLPGAVQSIYDLGHDTLDISFRTADEESYGRILLQLEGVNNDVIVQLISKENVVRILQAKQDGEFVFDFLSPGEYSIKCIHDLNGNGEWDTGVYLEKRQPEPVEFLPVDITVRSNWDHDVTMTLVK